MVCLRQDIMLSARRKPATFSDEKFDPERGFRVLHSPADGRLRHIEEPGHTGDRSSHLDRPDHLFFAAVSASDPVFFPSLYCAGRGLTHGPGARARTGFVRIAFSSDTDRLDLYAMKLSKTGTIHD